jgi:HEPN domain-containing protein
LHDIEPPKTHDLKELVEMCVKIDASFSVLIAKMDLLTTYTVAPRYPNQMGITGEAMKVAI